MKIAVFSDVHGNQYAFASFEKDLERVNPDKIVFLGDVFGYYYGQQEILNKLDNDKYHCLLGNHDQMFLNLMNGQEDLATLCKKYGSSYRKSLQEIPPQGVSFLKSLLPYWSMSIGDMRIGFFHGSPDDPLNGRVYPDTRPENFKGYAQFDYVFMGHTHHKMIRKFGKTVVINPGSLGQQRDGFGCSYCLFDSETCDVSFQIVNYDINRLAREVKMNDPEAFSLREVLYRKPRSMEC